MMHTIRFIAFAVTSLLISTNGLLSVPSMPWESRQLSGHPSLQEFASVQTETPLSVRLDVGADTSCRLFIDGLLFRLNGKYEPPEDQRVPLPGHNGPHPKCSSGPKAATLLQDGWFVGMAGRTDVTFEKGCWEMVWRDSKRHAGSLICGFDLPQEYQRNGVILPQGKIYFTFPIYTGKSYQEAKKRSAEVEQVAEEHNKEKKEEIDKMNRTQNPLMKALHYRNAFAAMEKYSNVRHHRNIVPKFDDILSIPGGLLLCRKGTVWTKHGSFHDGNHLLLGHASVRLGKESIQKNTCERAGARARSDALAQY